MTSYQAQESERRVINILAMCKLIVQSNFDAPNKHLTVSVLSDALNELKRILSKDKPIGKAFANIAKTYVFLCWMNREGKKHVPKEDLATMTYARHEDSLKKALDILKENKLISFELQPASSNNRAYYTYKAYSFDYKKESDGTVVYEYDIPICAYLALFYKELDSPKTVDILNTQSSPSSHICPTVSLSYKNPDTFEQQFLGWYDELSFGGLVVPRGHFSDKDRRFYHHFQTMPKEERLSTVLWDGEHVVEVWDAHSAFFIVMGYYLKYCKEYESEKERKKFTSEADWMMKLATSNQLYWSIMRYHNKRAQHPVYRVNRDGMKIEMQKYINKSYTRLFNKNGERTKHIDAMKCRYIDEFFQQNFPNIRLWLLNYPRHKEIKDAVGRDGKIHKNQLVSVSDIHGDIIPYEFELISMGLCKDLYDIYKVKSVTVHDAIYMKASDAERVSSYDIDELLSERLGISEKIPRSYALF